jgi:hypothetical protein
LQGTCDGAQNFWNLCVSISRRTHKATHLHQSTSHKILVLKEVLQEHTLRIQREEVKPCIVEDLAYPQHIQIQKLFTAKQIGNDNQNAHGKS